jgi:DNA gyrase subunit B
MVEEYGAKSIQVLEGLEPVRLRPAMYIGSTGPTGLHHLIWETIDNSIDEAMAGFCKKIDITHHADGSISVIDDGRGIPVDKHPTEKVPAVQVVLTKLHAGGKFDEKLYGASGGLHGVGVSCVNALSAKLIVNVWRSGAQHQQVYEKGVPKTTLYKVPTLRTKTGTEIQFWPDPTIFTEGVQFDDKIITSRLKELSYLNPGLKITFTDPKHKTTKYVSEKGLVDFVDAISPDKAIQPVAVQIQGKDGAVLCFAALRWTKSSKEDVRTYCNNINTVEGGTHLSGFKAGMTRAMLKFLSAYIPKSLEQPSPEDIREGLVAVLSLRIPQPQFEGQTKAKLGTSAAQGITGTIIQQGLTDALEKMKKDQLKLIADRIINATKARLAAQRARDNARKAADLSSDTLPGKLTDCQSRDPAEREIFIVEGDSAGGSAKQARDRKFQAILPIKGKILNCEKAAMKTILRSGEVQAIVAALGIGIGTASFDISRLRYHKIILMADADVDGAHIRTLLLTLFFRHLPEVIFGGHLYLAQPPLFRVKVGKATYWAYDEAQLRIILEKYKDSQSKPVISRFKGLGEMPPEVLWKTTMDPAHRKLVKIEINDIVCDETFQILMGDDVQPRADFITKNAAYGTLDI